MKRWLQQIAATPEQPQQPANTTQNFSGYAFPLLNEGDNDYIIAAYVGSNQEQIWFDLDINLEITWVAGSNLSDIGLGQVYYDCNLSQTCVPLNYTFNLSQYQFNASGEVVEDAILFPNNVSLNATPLIVFQNFTINNESGPASIASGAFAFGFGVGNATSVLDILAAEGLIQQKNYSLYLSTVYGSNFSDNTSTLIIGGYDASYLAASNFTYIPLAINYTWSIQVSNVLINSTDPVTNLTNTTSLTPQVQANISSIDNVIQVPDQDWLNLYNAVADAYVNCTNQSLYIACDCNGQQNHSSFPEILFEVNDINNTTQNLIVNLEQLVLVENNTCYIPFSYTPGVNSWELGLPFLRLFYSFFDETNQVVGFSPLTNPPA